MVPNASDLAARRLTVLAVLRVMGVTAWTITTAPLITMLSIALSGGADPWLGVAFLVVLLGGAAVGAALWLLAPALARWCLPTPKAHACPRCGYDLRSITEPRCPECGTVLTEEFLPAHVAPGPTASAQGRTLTAQITALLVSRLLAIVAAFLFGIGVVTVVPNLVAPPGWWDWTDILAAVAWLAYSVVGLGVCALPFIRPRRWVRWLVPLHALQDHPGPPPP